MKIAIFRPLTFSALMLAGFTAGAAEEPGLHACNHVIDRANHDRIVNGLRENWRRNNCDYHLEPPSPGAPRPGPIDPSKCSGIHRPETFAAAYSNTELGMPRISPLLQGRVHVGDMRNNCGGDRNARGDRNFIRYNVRGIQEADGSLPGGARLQCVCRRAVNPAETTADGKPKRPLSLSNVNPSPERPPVPDSRPPADHIVRGPYRPPPMPASDPPAGHIWQLRWETSGGVTRPVWRAVPNSIGGAIIGA